MVVVGKQNSIIIEYDSKITLICLSVLEYNFKKTEFQILGKNNVYFPWGFGFFRKRHLLICRNVFHSFIKYCTQKFFSSFLLVVHKV